MAVNIVKTPDIQKFLFRQAEGDDELALWLEMALTPSLLRREKNTREIAQLPDDAPEWLKKKWPQGGPFHLFNPDDELVNQVSHIVDWLEAARRENAPFLQKRDAAGVPLKMKNLNLEAAYNAANKYFERFNRKTPAAPLDPSGNIRLAMALNNGWHVVQLLTREALADEGKRMGNCVGTYVTDMKPLDWSFFSLRDRNGCSHVTISLHFVNKLDQCKGRGDIPPAEKYLPDIVAFLNAKGVLIPGCHRDLPGYFKEDCKPIQSGRHLPPEAMPESLFLKQSTAVSFPHFPTYVRTNAQIEDCPDLHWITGHLYVGNKLTIRNCPALRSIPDMISVRRDLVIDNCGIESLYINFDMDGDIYLTDCPNLRKLEHDYAFWWNLYITDCENIILPRTSRVGQWLTFRNLNRQTRVPGDFWLDGKFSVEDSPGVTSIGDCIHIKKDAVFKNLPNLKTLPRKLKIGGNLAIDNCGIRELPEDLDVGGTLTITNCPELSRIEAYLRPKGGFVMDNCPRLRRVAPFAAPPLFLKIHRCPGLGKVLPEQLRNRPDIQTDMSLV